MLQQKTNLDRRLASHTLHNQQVAVVPSVAGTCVPQAHACGLPVPHMSHGKVDSGTAAVPVQERLGLCLSHVHLVSQLPGPEP